MRSSRPALAVILAAGCAGGAALQSAAMVPALETVSYNDLSDLDKMNTLIAAAKAVGKSRHGVQSAMAIKASGMAVAKRTITAEPAQPAQLVAMDAETDVLDTRAAETPANGWGASSAARLSDAPLGSAASLVSPSESDLMLLQKGSSQHKRGEWSKKGKNQWKAAKEPEPEKPWQKKKAWHKEGKLSAAAAAAAADAAKLEDSLHAAGKQSAWKSNKAQVRRQAEPAHHRWTKMVAPRPKGGDPDLDAMRSLIKAAGDMGAASDDSSAAAAIHDIMGGGSDSDQQEEVGGDSGGDDGSDYNPDDFVGGVYAGGAPTMSALEALNNATARSWEALDMIKEAYKAGVPRIYMEAASNATLKTVQALQDANEIQVQLMNATNKGEEAVAKLEKANAPLDQLDEQKQALELLKAKHNITVSANQQAAQMALNIVNSMQNHSDFLNADLAPPSRLRK